MYFSSCQTNMSWIQLSLHRYQVMNHVCSCYVSYSNMERKKYAMYIKMTFQFKCPSRGSFSVAMLGFRMVLFKHVVFNTCFCARGHRYMKHLACATTYWVSRDEQMVSSPHHSILPELCQNNMNPHLNIFKSCGMVCTSYFHSDWRVCVFAFPHYSSLVLSQSIVPIHGEIPY